MHIPDNYLSPQTCAVMGAAMVPVWVISIKKIKKELEPAKLPMLGIGAAFSFLGMMFNIPLPGGTTGHAVGGTMIAAALGPYAACISISIALLVQAFLFGDGGILSFGANCFNMAFVLPFVGYAVYRLVEKALLRREESRSRSPRSVFAKGRTTSGACEANATHPGRKHTVSTIAAGIGSYVGINAAALCAAIEFGIQPLIAHDAAGNALYCPYGLDIAIPAMMIPHMAVAGVIEAAFTVAVYAFVRKTSPDLHRKTEVFFYGSPGKKQILLRHVSAGALLLVNALPCDTNFPGFRLKQAVDQAEDGALAAAGGADDGDKFSAVYMKTQMVDDGAFFDRILVDHLFKIQHIVPFLYLSLSYPRPLHRHQAPAHRLRVFRRRIKTAPQAPGTGLSPASPRPCPRRTSRSGSRSQKYPPDGPAASRSCRRRGTLSV